MGAALGGRWGATVFTALVIFAAVISLTVYLLLRDFDLGE